MHKLKHNLKRLAKSQDISIAQLARDTGIAPQTLNNWLAGADPRNLSQVKAVADYFGISIDELCFELRSSPNQIENYKNEINTGVFEVILRKIKKER